MQSAANLYQNNLKFHGVRWSQLFIFICWFIWKWRNKIIFYADFKGPYNASSIIFDYLLEWNNANLKPLSTASSKTEFLCWQKPPTGMFKLNVDGSRNAAGMIGAGGVIRDCDGNWCFGFSKNIGQGAEAFGLFTGLPEPNRFIFAIRWLNPPPCLSKKPRHAQNSRSYGLSRDCGS